MAKEVTNRQGAMEIVASAAETHALRLQEKFAALLGDCLEGKEKMPDVALLAMLMARKQRRANVALVHATEEHERELSDDAAPREARDASATTLTAEVVEIRSTLASTYGATILAELGIDGKTDVEPKAILAKSQRLLKELRDTNRKWPKPKRKGVKIDPTAWAEDLEQPIKTLEKALKDVARESREAQATGDAKDRAMATNDDVFMRVATLVAALFRAVGDDKLARKVRPSAKRPGRVIEEDETTPEEGAEGEG